MPKVSVIVPTYNCESYIRETLATILAQTFQDFEIVAIDSSSDSTPQILKEYGARVTVVNQPPAGVAAARNFGMQLAKGAYVAFIDGDDLWDPRHLEIQVSAMERFPESVMSFSNLHKFGDTEIFKSTVPIRLRQPFRDWVKRYRTDHFTVSHGSLHDMLLIGNVIPTSSVILRRAEALATGLFDTTFKIAEDYEYWLRLTLRHTAIYIDECLVSYRVRESGLSGARETRDLRFAAVHARILEKHLADYSASLMPVQAAKIRSELAMFKYRYGTESLKRGDSRTAQREILQSIQASKTVGLKFAHQDHSQLKRLQLLIKPYFVWILSCLFAPFSRKIYE